MEEEPNVHHGACVNEVEHHTPQPLPPPMMPPPPTQAQFSQVISSALAAERSLSTPLGHMAGGEFSIPPAHSGMNSATPLGLPGQSFMTMTSSSMTVQGPQSVMTSANPPHFTTLQPTMSMMNLPQAAPFQLHPSMHYNNPSFYVPPPNPPKVESHNFGAMQ